MTAAHAWPRPALEHQNISTMERLLRAAEEEFAAHGFAGARLTDISGRVGLSRSSVMYYFASKEALYHAVVRNGARRLDEALIFAVQGRDGTEARLMRGVAELVSFVESRPALARLAVREVLGSGMRGPALLLETALPALERIEVLLRPYAVDGLPVREFLIQIASSVALRVVAGDVVGLKERTIIVAEALFRPVIEASRRIESVGQPTA